MTFNVFFGALQMKRVPVPQKDRNEKLREKAGKGENQEKMGTVHCNEPQKKTERDEGNLEDRRGMEPRAKTVCSRAER